MLPFIWRLLHGNICSRSVLSLCQAFDDCTTLSSTFKLLESFEGLLERDAIAAEVAKKHKDMVDSFAADVAEVHELFLSHKAWPVLSKNAPPHSGWCAQ